jgi:methylenetetrahydrofolate reductase (NADPH)
MKISEIFEQKQTVFSFEVFPPKKTSSIESISSKLAELSECKPDFISVTYGAGGGGASALTLDLCRSIIEDYKLTPMMHLTCVNSSREDVDKVLEMTTKYGIENILALRGDIVPELPRQTDFTYASDLVTYIKSKGDYHVSGACYPEGHPECENAIDDILNLKKKVDAGADYIITQMFFDNNDFYHFVKECRSAGITVPIIPGLKPVSTLSHMDKLPEAFSLKIPEDLKKEILKCKNNSEVFQLGIEWCAAQSKDLIANGAPAIHYYTMGRAKNIKEVLKRVF